MLDDGGLAKFRKRLAAIPDEVRAEVLPALQKSADEMAQTMRQLAEQSRDTGELIDSIEITPAGQNTPPHSQPGGSSRVPDNAIAITVGNKEVRYPHLVEYGTKKAPAQPFFWPAIRSLRKRTMNRLKRASRTAAKKAWSKK